MTTYQVDAADRGIERLLDTMPIGRLHWRVIVAVGLGLFFDMYEVFLSGSMNVALGKDFQVSGMQLKLLLASAFLGMFVGAALLGRAADRLGRRRAFILNLVWYSAWSFIGAFAPNAWFLVVARFLAGIGVGAEYPVADAYLSDVLPKESRGRMSTWAYTASFLAVPTVGFLALWLNATPVLGVSGWRWLMALGGLGAVGVLVLRRTLPESPRWLNSVGRTDEASAVVRQFAAAAGLPAGATPSVATPVGGHDVGADGTVDDPATPAAPSPAHHAGHPAADLAGTDVARLGREPYRRRFVMLIGFHLLQTFGYYGFGTLAALVLVARGHSVANSLLFTALSFLGYPVGSLLSTPLVNRFERKFLLIGSIVALGLSGLAFAMSSASALIVLFGFLTTAISNVFSNVFHIYQAEIFPTGIRGTAVGAAYSVSRLSSGALPFVLLPVLDDSGPTAMFLVVAAALAVTATLVAVLGPRTAGRSLREINPV